MSRLTRCAGWSAMLLALPLYSAVAFAGPVEVQFVDPEAFTDIRDRRFSTPIDKNPNLNGIRRHIEHSAKRYLVGGQTLLVQFNDIDLAGDIEPGVSPYGELRMVRRMYPPRMSFQYTLRDAMGAEVRSGNVELRDVGFMDSVSGRRSDSLRYEKQMLDQWMRQELGG